MEKPKIGIVTLLHPQRPLPEAESLSRQAAAALRNEGFEVVHAGPPGDEDEARHRGLQFLEAHVDLAVFFFGAWMPEEIPLSLDRALGDTPRLLWAPPFIAGDPRTPSYTLTGLTATASNLRHCGRRFLHHVGAVDDDSIERVARAARAAYLLRLIARSRFGMVSAPCPGMIDVSGDNMSLICSLGVRLVHLDLNEVFEGARSVSQVEVKRVIRDLKEKVGGVEATDEDLAEAVKIYLVLKDMRDRYRLGSLCVRCWPEFRQQMPHGPCLALALLADEGSPTTCEVDAPAMITSYAMGYLSKTTAASYDLLAHWPEEDVLKLGHCGSAPFSLAGDPKHVKICPFFRTGAGAMVEFSVAPGTVTLAKLMRPRNGALSMFVARGETVSDPAPLRGSVASVRPERGCQELLDSMLVGGVEHHLMLCPGDITEALGDFCTLAGIEVVEG